MTDIFYAKEPGSWLVSSPGRAPGSSGSRQLLLGQRLHVTPGSLSNGWVAARTVPSLQKNGKIKQYSGFVERARLSERQQLKVFYVDVGQGDASLIEAEDVIIIIDGGPSRGFSDQLAKRLEALKRADADAGRPIRTKLHINAVIVSHFDKDHYVGLTRVLNNQNYTFGTIYHNGLPRYGENAGKDLHLGTLSSLPGGGVAISADLDGLASAQQMIDDNLLLTESGRLNKFGKFLDAAIRANAEQRLDQFMPLVIRAPNEEALSIQDTGDDLGIEVLGPVSLSQNGDVSLPAFPDPHNVTPSNPNPSPSGSHTINGNSIVLRVTYGQCSFLFGGDLNQPAQRYLHARYGGFDRFSADVNKACHHGSSDFEIDYVRAIRPFATVFSSGDNGNYDHPMPDAMGTAARHSQGDYPLVFSTELAREVGGKGIHFGHINARSNGDVIVMAQKKETPRAKTPWHTFPLPHDGPFGAH